MGENPPVFPLRARDAAYVAVDVETTGFSPRLHDRVIEIAMVQVTGEGIEDEFVTLVNPDRDVGRTDIHGIRASDLMGAPSFDEIADEVIDRLRERVLVAHNAKFDNGFIGAELTRAGYFLPAVPSLCTLQLAYRIFPGLGNHQLVSCCDAAGIRGRRWHSALEDARSVAALLHALIRASEGRGWDSLESLGCLPLDFPIDLWPPRETRQRPRVRVREDNQQRADLPFLARVVASLGPIQGNNARLAPYMDLLSRALEDRRVTTEEADALAATALEWGLTREEAMGAHQAYLESVLATALADGRVSGAERHDLEGVAHLLALDASILDALIERHLEQGQSTAGETLQVSNLLSGMTVCFTGTLLGRYRGETITRELAHELARSAGLVTRASVTKDLDLLVVSDPNTGSAKGKAAERFGTRIMAEAAFWSAIGVRSD